MSSAVAADRKKDFAEMLEHYVSTSLPRRGELLQGTVVERHEGGLVIDLGMKRDGIVPCTDLERLEETHGYGSGDQVYVMVTEPRDDDENVVLSVFEARRNQDWLDADDLLESGDIWVGKPTGHNRGGLVVPFGDLRGFVPASHIADLPRGLSLIDRRGRLEAMIGMEIGLKLIEVDRLCQRLIFSQRQAQSVWNSQRRARLLQELEVGQVMTGTVSGLRDFGAFVDLGGTDGLVHVSELAWRRLEHPREVVRVGEQVEVKVIRIDPERHRIGLSMKELLQNPWERVGEQIATGQLITGRLTRIALFGAFAEVCEGVEGLLHKNEIPHELADLIVPGNDLQFKVTKVDVRRQRIGLSLRDLDVDHTDSDSEETGAHDEEQDSMIEIHQEVPTSELLKVMDHSVPTASTDHDPTAYYLD